MSQASKRDGCYECSRRRIRCDKDEPQCLKCQKKGIECSGQGIRYRFRDGRVTSDGKHKTKQISDSMQQRWRGILEVVNADRNKPSNLVSSRDLPPIRSRRIHGRKRSIASSPPSALPGQVAAMHEMSHLADGIRNFLHPPPQAGLQVLDSRSRMLFHHFSEAIAPNMVVLDPQSNGYCDIILPIAYESPILQSAVSVVAAFHLSAEIPELQHAAEVGQMNIISRLRHDAASLPSNQVFNASTWATILVLLVGETITGGNDFVYLLEVLRCLTQGDGKEMGISPSTRRFLMQQTKMFELFGFPLSHESKGIQTMQIPPDHYLDFMFYSTTPDSQHYVHINLIKDAIRIACEIYRRRAESMLSHNESIGLLELLRLRVLDMGSDTEGAHALVWTYFVGASESVLHSHRDFFTERLRGLYDRTKFRSIPAALETMEKTWAMQGLRRWTEFIIDENPILVL